jgi:TM2 domain-containing membrane protein YozV
MTDQDPNYPQYGQPGSVPPQADPQYAPQPQYDYSQQGQPQYDYSQQGQYQQQYQQAPAQPINTGWGSVQKDKWVAAVLAFVLGTIGIHKFYLGYKQEGMVMLLVSIIGAICTLGLGTAVMGVIGLIEAVKYVILTQEDFEATYVVGRKGWF